MAEDSCPAEFWAGHRPHFPIVDLETFKAQTSSAPFAWLEGATLSTRPTGRGRIGLSISTP
jgi:hypothetical protein